MNRRSFFRAVAGAPVAAVAASVAAPAIAADYHSGGMARVGERGPEGIFPRIPREIDARDAQIWGAQVEEVLCRYDKLATERAHASFVQGIERYNRARSA